MKETELFNTRKTMARYALGLLIATIIINSLSAFIRHAESGLGCQPWPQCYAVIGEHVRADDAGDVAQKALAPTDLAKKVHRTVATVLVIGVLLLIGKSRTPGVMQGANASLPYLLLAIIILLSVVGPASYLKTLPIIAVINLVGGLVLMATCWWLYLQFRALLYSSARSQLSSSVASRLSKYWLLGWLFLSLQILLGIWLSANFAADACPQILSCGASGDYLNSGSESFWYFRELNLDTNGRVLFDASAVTIHWAHRILVPATAFAIITASVVLPKPLRVYGLIAVVVILAQCSVGVAAIIFDVPLILIMLHNLLATLLLLVVMAVNFFLLQAK